MKPPRRAHHSTLAIFSLLASLLSGTAFAQRIALEGAAIVVDRSEPSYLQYGADDLASYLTRLTGKKVAVERSAQSVSSTSTLIAIGEKAARRAGVLVDPPSAAGTSMLRSSEHVGRTVLVVAGSDPHATNAALATFVQLLRFDDKAVFVDGPLERIETPQYSVRGIHLNGWPLNYPYAFRTWKEEDWKRFVDIAWAQRVNLVYLWPFMEIIPVPLSKEDAAYLEEVRRVVDYAQKKRGMEVWIMQSANRIGVSDCGSSDPRLRTYWVPRDCQIDMNPADGEQFARLMRHFEAFYKIVRNADGYCMIDSDPGGWPGSPLSDQAKIFNGARKLLDRYSTLGTRTKLIDWMWLGWGRHPTGEESGDKAIAFMESTIRNFRENLAEPWELIAGISPYLDSARNASALNKTIFLQYGAIEMEPAFPATNLGRAPVNKVFEVAAKYPGLKGVMGNNELMLLQFPRTYQFFEMAWDPSYQERTERQILLDVGRQLHPDHTEQVADGFDALLESDPARIRAALANISRMASGDAGRPGALGRFLFPDEMSVLKNLQLQLEVRAARQEFIAAMNGTPTFEQSQQLVESYFDKLLAWNQATGWNKMVEITIWRTPIYEEGRDLEQAMARLKKVIAQDRPYASYEHFEAFFAAPAKRLVARYGADSAMITCIEPFKLAMIQGW
jgi:hypothetical protein